MMRQHLYICSFKNHFRGNTIKKLMRVVAAGLIFFLLYLLIFNALYVPDPATATMFGGFYTQDRNSMDVVYIGSSAAYAYFNAPMAFHEYGFSTYDFCSGAQPLSAAKYLIKEAQKTQDPKVYIVDLREVCSEIDDPIYIRRVTSYMPWSVNRIAAARGMMKSLVDTDRSEIWDYLLVYPFFHNNWETKLTDGSGEFIENLYSTFYSEWRTDGSLLPRLKRSTEVGEDQMVHKGYLNIWYDAQDWHNELLIDRTMYETAASALPNKQEAALRELCEYCTKLDTPVLFVSSPSVLWPEYYAQLNWAYDIISSYGLSYFDGNAAMDEMGLIDSADWYEGGHLNSFGAAKYTRCLSEYLVAHYDLPDHRSDAAYAAWEEEYQEDRTHLLQHTALLFHLLDETADRGYDATLTISNMMPSDLERTSLERLGISVGQDGALSCLIEIKGGKVAAFAQTDGDAAYPAPYASCTVYEKGTEDVLRNADFYLDVERGLMSSEAQPVDLNVSMLLAEATASAWRDNSLMESVAEGSADLIEAFELHLEETEIYADCVMALRDADCAGQTIYAEFKNEAGLYRVWRMETVERQDWADLLENQLYVWGGADVHIPYGELPEGAYSVRLFREKGGVTLYTGAEWVVAVSAAHS